MHIRKLLSLGCLLLLSSAAEQGRGEPQDYSTQLPRIAPQTPADSIATMKIAPGYRIELVASEPHVFDPVAIAFDQSARLYAIEMCDYSEQETEHLGNVRLLEDRDRNGTYETSILFAEKLSWPTAIACYDGGVFVGAAPDIWYLKDTNGDGASDIREKVFTGFGRSNVQGLMNSLCWGLDNRLYGQTSSSGGTITRPDVTDSKPVSLGGRDFSFDPRTRDIRSESGGGQHGMSFDDWGNRFSCQNSDHLQLHVYDERYQKPDNLLPLPSIRQSIAIDGPQATVYRRSEVEPWRILRTNLRVTKQVPGLVEGGGRPSGYFTSATGVTIYRGDAMPELRGLAFVGDVGSNIVHRKRLKPNGVSMVGERIDQDSEFIAATDIWFRPVQFSNAPDGSLFLLDLYREVIEHPKSLPEVIKKHLDLTSGRDRGRLYRIIPDKGLATRDNDLNDRSTDELIELLGHSNSWHRETSAQLLVKHISDGSKTSPTNASILLQKIDAAASRIPQGEGKLQCLGVLSYFRHLPASSSVWLKHEDPRVRSYAVRLLEPMANEDASLRSDIRKLASDANSRVRFQVALTLAALPQIDTEKQEQSIAVKSLIMSTNNDSSLESAAANASRPFLVDFSNEIIASGAGQGGQSNPWSESASLLVGRCFALAASEAQIQTIDQGMMLPSNPSTAVASWVKGCLRGLATRWKYDLKKLESCPQLAKVVLQSIEQSKQAGIAEQLSVSQKLDSIQSIRWSRSNESADLLFRWMDLREPWEVQLAALDGIASYANEEVINTLITKYTSLSPSIRTKAADLLLSKKGWLEILLRRAGEGGFDLRDLDASRQNALQQHADSTIREKANSLLGRSTNSNREEVLAKYRESLTLRGNQEIGKQHFAKSCAACHRLDGVGYELGPNLATFKYRGAEAILQNVIDPNREVNPQYISYTILTTDDRTITGMIESETATHLTLVRGDNARDTIPRSEIEQLKSSRVSIMPEGLENQLNPQAMADLLAYLLNTP